MKYRNLRMYFALFAMVCLTLGCGTSSTATPVPPATTVPDTPTQTSVPANQPPTTSAIVSIPHVNVPVDLPNHEVNRALDQDSSATAAKKSANGGDRFSFNRVERPFNANTMDVYYPYLDIKDTWVFQDDTWIYASITLVGRDANNALSGIYAAEFDLDVNGKADWLVMASNPAATTWTSDGVQAWWDENKDVGNVSAEYSDLNATTGDGFEKLMFDQGNGADPDSAFVRISPDDPNMVQIAVKRSLFGGDDSYMIRMWAGAEDSLKPSLFDINDHFTHQEAGAADPALEPSFYPIKALAEIDNSCRMAVGFSPTGSEPGLCDVFVPIKPVVGGQPAGSTPPPLFILPQVCFASLSQINDCNATVNYQWDSTYCTCRYVGPK